MDTLARLLTTLKTHPLWALAWSLCTASAALVISHEYGAAERAGAVQRMHTRVGGLHDEFRRAEALVAVWDTGMSVLADTTVAIDAWLTPARLRPRTQAATMADVVVRIRDQRRRLSPVFAAVRNVS